MRRRLALVASLVMLAGLVTGVSAAPALADTGCPVPVAYPGAGTVADPFLITLPGHLQYLRDTPADWDNTVNLAADINMRGCVWDRPIGTGPLASWQGAFDGQSHVITGLDVHVTTPVTTVGSSKYYAGLFGYSVGVVRNVGFTGGVSVTAAYADAGEIFAGGLVGVALPAFGSTWIQESFAAGDVTVNVTATADVAGPGDASADVRVGGLVGWSEAEILNSYSLSTLTNGVSLTGRGTNPPTGTATVNFKLGGLVGQQSGNNVLGSMVNSYSSGSSSDRTVVNGFDNFFGTTFKGGAVGEHVGGTNSGVVWPSANWPGGVGAGNAAGLVGATPAGMVDPQTYIAAGWQLTSGFAPARTWGICPGYNAGLPYLTEFHTANPCRVCSAGATWVYDDTDIQAAIAGVADDSIICVAAEIDLTATLALTNVSVRLEGAYPQAALDGGDARRILSASFQDPADDTLTIVGLTLRDGRSPGQEDGGCLYMVGDGGATGDVLRIESSTFSNCASGGNGGGLSASNVPSVTLEDDTFTGNRATSDGGALVAGGVDGRVNARWSTFERNVADNDGGAIAVSILADVATSTFRQNSASRHGGAIYATGARVVGSGLSFDRNQTGQNGGAVYATGDADPWAVSLIETTFTANDAGGSGGGIFSMKDVDIFGVSFDSNLARGGSGGAIYSAGGVTSILSTYAANTALGAGGRGGALRAEGNLQNLLNVGVVSLDDSFLNNQASLEGGAISASRDVSTRDSDFERNQATDPNADGGAMRAGGAVQIQTGAFLSNTAGRDAGAVFSADSIDIADSTFRSNSFTRQGAAARVGGALRAASVIASGTSFISNGLTPQLGGPTQGGAIYVTDSLTLTNVTSSRNSADTGGFVATGPNANAVTLRYVTSSLDSAWTGGALAVDGPGAVALIGSALQGVATDRCHDADAPQNANFTADSVGTFVTDPSCGWVDDSITLTNLDRMALWAPVTTDDTPGAQVLIPDDSSVLINAVPSTLVAGVTTDQLGVSRAVPMGLTTVGAVQVLPTPAFTVNPQSQSVIAGSPVTFSSAASGGTGPLTYQWHRSFDNGVNWAPIPGATTLAYSIASALLVESGVRYRTVATDGNGRQATSAAATLTVNPPPAPGPGPGPAPSPSPSPSPAKPDSPEIVRIVAGIDSATVEFTAPSGAVDGYEYSLDDSVWLVPEPLVTSSPMVIGGLVPGMTYSVRLRSISGAETSDPSNSMTFTTRPVVTIVIRGSRDGERVTVTGRSTGLAGETVTPRIKLRGQRAYVTGRVQPTVDNAGRFEWTRKTGKRVSVYFMADGVRSNAVTVRAHKGSRR